MGQEISTATFCQSDFEQFRKRLEDETEILSAYFTDNVFDCDPLRIGVELEGCLVDQFCNPAARSECLISGLNDKKIVPELGKYNFEINTTPINFGPNCFEVLHKELKRLWEICCKGASKLDTSAVSIGILPTYQQNMLVSENIYPYKRYHALNEQLFKYRKDRLITTKIEGIDNFSQTFNNVLIEAVTTSLQIHVQISLADSVRKYNTAQIISAPMIAISANSPFLFGKNLWCDTRIPVFEQSASIPYGFDGSPTRYKRVTLGHGFVENSLFELFTENYNDYLVLLPELSDEPSSKLHHLRLHNGTIWRWNRPLIGMDNPKKPNLRIEHRVNPAGPSIQDDIANTAFYMGLLTFYSKKEIPPEREISFKDVTENFYRAAKQGLNSKLIWLNHKTVKFSSLILEELLPNAEIGLQHLDIDKDSIEFYLQVIKQRVSKQLTGAEWQRKFIDKYGFDFNNMLYNYLNNQTEQKAVYQWKI